MKVEKHIVFSTETDKELIEYLDYHHISWNTDGSIAVLDIFDDNMHWPFVSEYVKKANIRVMSECVFTKDELSSAKWLRIRSQWRCGYPQPESAFAYTKLTYNDESCCRKCGAGLKQKDSFRIKKTPKWGRRFFMMLNWVEDELFVNDIAMQILKSEGLSGIEFYPVKDKRGENVLENIHQLDIQTVMEKGLIESSSGVDEIINCPYCGNKKYHPSGMGVFKYNGQIFDDSVDFLKTGENFGWGAVAPRHILISQKAYNVIQKYKMSNSLVFEPVELV